MSVILSTSRHHEGQEIVITVKYNPSTNTADEIKSVSLKTHGHTYPVGNFMMAIDEFEQAINKIVDNTDWREIWRESKQSAFHVGLDLTLIKHGPLKYYWTVAGK